MIEGLKNRNITIEVSKDYFAKKVQELRDQGEIRVVKTNQAIKDIDNTLNQIYDARYETGVYAEVMYELGIRSSEAIELIKHPEKYIITLHNRYEVQNLIGKGNHTYEAKKISVKLINKIESIVKLPSKSTLSRDLKKLDINPHQFRYSFAKNETDHLYKSGLTHKNVLRKVSKDLNHKRGEMTNYYIKRS
jgi:integrase